MIVLGIDPGIAITGYGFIKLNDLNEPEMLAYGVIDSTAVRGTSSRLIFLFDEFGEILFFQVAELFETYKVFKL